MAEKFTDPTIMFKQDEPPANGIDLENVEGNPEDSEEIITNILKDDSKVEGIAHHLQNYWGNFDGYLPGGYKRGRDREFPLELGDPDSKTQGNLEDDIDRSIDELGLDKDKIEKLRNEIKELRQKNDWKQGGAKQDELFRYIAPIYLTILKKGYTRHQLFG